MSEPVDSVAMSAADCGKSGQVPVMALESMVRDAFAWRGRCEDLSPRQIADAYENLSLLDDAGMMELLPALLVCELRGHGIQSAWRDMLIHFLDGARLKRQPDGSWWCNSRLHRAEIEFAKGMFLGFTASQKAAVAEWLTDYARSAFKTICPDAVESAILFWESGCRPEEYDFPDYRRMSQQGIGYSLVPENLSGTAPAAILFI